MPRVKWSILVCLFAGILSFQPNWCGAATTQPTSRPAKAAPKLPYTQYVHGRVNAVLDAAQADGDFPAAAKALGELFDQVIVSATDDHLDPYREADFGLRLVNQLSALPEARRAELLKYLRKNPALAGTLVFLVSTGLENPEQVYELLDRLRQKHADLLEKYANLAAAVCVVDNRPLTRQINENKVTAPDAVAIFDYYVANESHLFFGVKNVPAELLIYVVDTTSSIDDMTWALRKYAGDKEVGKRFFDIKYDYDAFRKNTPKQVTLRGFTLPNILQYGGVCADQAYFATTVGKAIGVPTAYAVGESAESGHAWVGFLQAEGNRGGWNFNSGRYAQYQGVRGNVLDPQTRQEIPDSYVSVLGELIGTRAVDRQNAVALTDAARRMIAMENDSATPEILAPPTDQLTSTSVRPVARKIGVVSELALVEQALRQCAGYSPAWFTVRDLATANKLSLAEKRRWADVLLRLGAQKYPDFTLAILRPMVKTISNPKEQDQLWTGVFPLFQNRFDLAASIKMSQAELWESQKQMDRAGQLYTEVIERYANAGPFVFAALQGAEKVLRESKRADKVVTLYGQTWSRVKPPQEMAPEFMRASNWYKLGKEYAQKLQEAGDAAKAQTILAQIEKGSPPAAKP